MEKEQAAPSDCFERQHYFRHINCGHFLKDTASWHTFHNLSFNNNVAISPTKSLKYLVLQGRFKIVNSC